MEKIIEVLTEIHLESCGGYPYEWAEHAGKVFIAGLDDGNERAATRLDIYDSDSLRAWQERALQFQEDHPDESWETCVFETQDGCNSSSLDEDDDE